MPTISMKAIQKVKILRSQPELDSAVTVYNMWSPLRARKLVRYSSLQPFVPFETFGDPKRGRRRMASTWCRMVAQKVLGREKED